MINFKKLNQVNVFKLFIILVLFVPVNGIGLMNGLPLTDFKHLSFIIIFVFTINYFYHFQFFGLPRLLQQFLK